MRQDRKSLSLMDMPDLPVEAFRHVGNRKIKLHGGGNPISDLVEGIGDAISDVGSAIDDAVNDIIPGGWVTVAAVTLIACGIPDPELLAMAEEGTLTTAELEAAGYDALTVAESAATVAPEVVATTEAAMASGVSPEVLAMANATADPIAALNAAAGWTASDAGYLMSIGYAGPVVDPVTGISTDVGTAARAQNAGWTSAADSGVEGGVWQDAHGTVFDASGHELAYGDFSADIVSSVPTSVNGVEGVQVTDGMGNTWFEPVGGGAPAAPVYEAPIIADTAPVLPADQTVVAGTQSGSQIPGAYSVDASGTYFDVNGEMVAQTTSNGGVVGVDGIQYVEPNIVAGPEIGYGPAIPEPITAPIVGPDIDPAAVQSYLNQGYTQAQIDAAIEANPNGGWGRSLSWGEMGAPGAAVPETVIAENTIPVTLSDGSIGAFDPATGTVYDAAGAVDTAATETMQGAGAGFGEGTQYAEAAKDATVATDAGLAEAPFRVEVTGAAGTAEAPSFVTGPLTEGSQLATTAEIDSGLATWNPAANAWEVTAATLPEAVAPVVPGLTLGQGAALGGGGLVAAGALGGGSSGAVLAGGPAPVTPTPVTPVTPAPTLPPVVDATPVPVTPPAPVTPVPAPVTTGPISPETAAVVGGGAVAAGALGGGAAASAPATVITPTGDIIGVPTTPATTLPPVVDATPVPVTPPAPISPPPPPTTPGPPVVDAVGTPVPPGTETLPGSISSGGLSATDLALIAAGWTIVNGILTPPVPEKKGYGPIDPVKWGSMGALTNPGLNPGWIQSRPMYNTTSPVQSQYYWGNHPYSYEKADLANYNNVPHAPATPWGLQQAQAPFDVNTYIRQMMTPEQQAALAGTAPQYYGPVAPATPVGGKV